MRLLISVLAMLVVVFLATQAKADLVADLRSGRSDIKAVPSGFYKHMFFKKRHHALQSEPNFRAMAVQWYSPYGRWGVWGRSSAAAAVKEALSECKKRHGTCRLYSVGEQIVAGFSKQKLADVIEAYDRGNKKTTTARKSKTPSKYRELFCLNKVTGGVQNIRSYKCPYRDDREITKAEYDRLKNKKITTAISSTGSFGETHYCKSTGGFLHQKKVSCELSGDEEITNTEYDRL